MALALLLRVASIMLAIVAVLFGLAAAMGFLEWFTYGISFYAARGVVWGVLAAAVGASAYLAERGRERVA